MEARGQAGCFGKIILVLFGMGVLALVWLGLAGRPEFTPTYREQDIYMMQPKGLPNLDNLNSETNLNNAQANQANKEGESSMIMAEASATQMAVQNCATLNNCFSPQGTVAMSGGSLLFFAGICGVIAVMLFGAFLRKFGR